MPEAAGSRAPAIGERARLVSYTVIRKPPSAFADEGMYAVCIVDLAGGGRAIGRLDPHEPAPALGAGLRVVRHHKGVAVFAPIKE